MAAMEQNYHHIYDRLSRYSGLLLVTSSFLCRPVSLLRLLMAITFLMSALEETTICLLSTYWSIQI